MTASDLCSLALANGMDAKAAMSFDWSVIERAINETTMENLTIFALRIRNDLYLGGGMGKQDFDINYLSRLGEYEKKLAKREGIAIGE